MHQVMSRIRLPHSHLLNHFQLPILVDVELDVVVGVVVVAVVVVVLVVVDDVVVDVVVVDGLIRVAGLELTSLGPDTDHENDPVVEG